MSPDSPVEPPDADGAGLDPILLARWLAREPDDAARAHVDAWRDVADPVERARRAAFLERLAHVWRATDGRLPADARWTTDDVERALAEVTARAARSTAGSSATTGRRTPARPFAWRVRGVGGRSLAWQLAAGVLVVAGAAGAWLATSGRGGDADPAVAAAPDREVVTAAGQLASLTLGDGTEVRLAPRSRLRIPAGYGERSRELRLEGEAYFVVTHDSTRPFTVHAAHARVVDLGTAFVVRAPGSSDTSGDAAASGAQVEVAVTEGRVALGPEADSGAAAPAGTHLVRGQVGRLASGARTADVRAADVDAWSSWTRGEFVFDASPLADVVATLERWHDVEIRLSDSTLAARRVTATFRAASLDDALNTLSTVLSTRVRRDGRVITLSAVAPTSARP